MTTKTIEKLAFETDTKLAELYREEEKLEQRIARHEQTLTRAAGATFYYVGRGAGARRVTDMGREEALERLAGQIAELEGSDYGRIGSTSIRDIRESIERIETTERELEELAEERRGLEAIWSENGRWTRFFLVTSSAGHVHRSMHCSTCRVRTTYGWLPRLSGKTDEVAIEELGETLCSVCFPEAPIAGKIGKITKAAAAKLAA